MRKWKRVETAGGVRFRSALDAHEAVLLNNLVTSLLDMLDDRESSSPTDELWKESSQQMFLLGSLLCLFFLLPCVGHGCLGMSRQEGIMICNVSPNTFVLFTGY